MARGGRGAWYPRFVGKRGVMLAPPRGLDVVIVDSDLAIFAWDLERPQMPALTDAERDVLVRITSGASNADIARARKSSVRTVANQVASLLRKLDARSRYELIQRFAGERAP